MTERAQALEALKRVARDIGTVKDVASRRSDPDRDNRRMLARLSAWRSEILRALNILEAVQPPPPVGSPTTAWIPTDGCDCATCNVARRSTPVEPAVTPTLQDALSALRYIRETHGALYGVGWDRLLPVEPAGASHTGWGPDKTRDCHCTACQGEPAGASEPPSEYIDIEPDICVVRIYRDGSWLEDVRGGGRRRASFPEPAPVSPVEPTPEPPKLEPCDHSLDWRNCSHGCEPTGAPAPCVWRDISTTQPAVDDIVLVYEEGHIGKALLDASGRWLDVEAGRDDAWFSVPPSHWMPFPTPPLTVER